ncbi:nuclease-related domain-containing protein [uncultured Microbacterium sp.]|uniref:nuclease-related domain-containing protein n=1 Tax=uncultured Microbacterium sp. TaxID=191216 RepID=UPI0028E4498A|nr:nuclease-related domain-containing protein [uncultured Microbacterium sp.]
MTLELGPDDKRMRLRYAGTCRLCGRAHDAGADAIYERTLKVIRCVACPPKPVEVLTVDGPILEESGGDAGTSARREYERRRDAREQRIRAEHPKLGGLILALSDDPQSTKAWERGAVGEELMAKQLADLPDTFRVMHDRRIRGTRANIDHIAVGPSGVWVIDAKRYKDKRPELRVDGGIIRPRVESLRVGGRDQTKLVDGVKRQVERVREALADDAIPIAGVLCFLEADWPLVGGSFTVDEVHVLWPRLLVKRMTEAPGAALDVSEVHARLTKAFPVACTRASRGHHVDTTRADSDRFR